MACEHQGLDMRKRQCLCIKSCCSDKLERCICPDEDRDACLFDHDDGRHDVDAAPVDVPVKGEFFVRDGVVYQVANSFYDTEGRISIDLGD